MKKRIILITIFVLLFIISVLTIVSLYKTTRFVGPGAKPFVIAKIINIEENDLCEMKVISSSGEFSKDSLIYCDINKVSNTQQRRNANQTVKYCKGDIVSIMYWKYSTDNNGNKILGTEGMAIEKMGLE